MRSPENEEDPASDAVRRSNDATSAMQQAQVLDDIRQFEKSRLFRRHRHRHRSLLPERAVVL